jgi:two-component system, response regulator, stage 0 sporulation protein A
MGQISILIADNSNEFTELLNDFLSLKTDIKVIGIARDGAETLEMIDKSNPDVLLLDIIMPRIDGLEVLQRLSVKAVRPYVLVMSALSSDEIKKQALAAGANHYFVKPLNLESVLSKIREVKN